MNFETSYTVTEELQMEAAKQMFLTVYLKRKWIPILALWIVGGISFLWVDEIGWLLTGTLLTVASMLTVMWVKTYFKLQENSMINFRTMNDPLVTLTITREDLEISSSSGSRRIAWNKVDEVAETKDFLIPMIRKLPMMCLPKEHLTTEVFEMIRRRWVV